MTDRLVASYIVYIHTYLASVVIVDLRVDLIVADKLGVVRFHGAVFHAYPVPGGQVVDVLPVLFARQCAKQTEGRIVGGTSLTPYNTLVYMLYVLFGAFATHICIQLFTTPATLLVPL